MEDINTYTLYEYKTFDQPLLLSQLICAGRQFSYCISSMCSCMCSHLCYDVKPRFDTFIAPTILLIVI